MLIAFGEAIRMEEPTRRSGQSRSTMRQRIGSASSLSWVIDWGATESLRAQLANIISVLIKGIITSANRHSLMTTAS